MKAPTLAALKFKLSSQKFPAVKTQYYLAANAYVMIVVLTLELAFAHVVPKVPLNPLIILVSNAQQIAKAAQAPPTAWNVWEVIRRMI